MSVASALAGTSAMLAVALGLSVIRGARHSFIRAIFSAGMMVLAADRLCQIVAERTHLAYWESGSLLCDSLLSGIWLVFSLVYARGNYSEFLIRWRLIIFAAFGFGALLIFPSWNGSVIDPSNSGFDSRWVLRLSLIGVIISLVTLLYALMILMNLERTYRAAVGTMRWRIKFIVLGVGLIFSVRAYVACQALLYNAVDVSLQAANSAALFIGCALMVRSLLRMGHFDMDVYPSNEALTNSFTILIAGIYLLIVGVLAKIVAFLGGDASFSLKTFVVLLGLVILTLVLLSDRVRMRTRRFVSRHFQRPFYDYRMVWRRFTQSTARRVEDRELCLEVAQLVSEIFQALSVAIWLLNDSEKLTIAASTSASGDRARSLEHEVNDAELTHVLATLKNHPAPINLDASSNNGFAALKKLHPDEFHKGGNRICVPLVAGGDLLGIMILGDRVSGLPFLVQDFDLLKSIADQVATNLLNIKLSQRLTQAKQLEAFQAMSAFFVHDLKNTASTLSLMLQNLPTHFNDPRFREDALRGVSKTVNHINQLIQRLGVLRQELTIRTVEGDLNAPVLEALKSIESITAIEVLRELRPLPNIRLDPAQIQNVVTNLLLNARDAIGPGGTIRVETNQQNGWAVLTVADSGCGMNPEFVQKSLFRPFQTTKKQGIGIGMFQCKMIIEAHRGKIEVQSELAKGTIFRILLPATV